MHAILRQCNLNRRRKGQIYSLKDIWILADFLFYDIHEIHVTIPVDEVRVPSHELESDKPVLMR